MARSLDRGWRIVWLALAWLGVVALQLEQPTLWPQPASAAVALVAVGLAALAWRRRGSALFALAAAALALAAFASTDWRAAPRSAWPSACRRRWKGRTSWSPVSWPSCRG
jgi:hypothetical protein